VRLPAAIASENQIDSLAADASSWGEGDDHASLIDGLSVLVVDDDDETRKVIGAHLEVCGARVLSVASAAAALDLLRREHVDVMLADVAMPGEDGYTLIRTIRSLAAPAIASIPAAALTAFARNEDREKALQAGFQLHLAKPVDARSLVAAVAQLGKGGQV
jgi:CheY-like chemotaxis protein